MKHVSVLLGIAAGIAGLLGAAFAYFVGSFSVAFGGGADILVASLLAVALSIAGIVGAVMSKGKSRTGAYLMMIAGIDGLIAVSFGYIIAGPLFIIAAVMALKEAKHDKIEVKKTQRLVYAGVGVAIFALIMSSYGNSGTGSSSTSGTSTVGANGGNKEELCPEIAQLPSSYEFKWGESYSGEQHLYLYADFLTNTQFANNWKLENAPGSAAYFRDTFPCELGSTAGQSTNKLYCTVNYAYEPRLIDNEIDSDGNIVHSEYRYIKEFVFDAKDKNIENANDLNSLTLESYDCSASSF
jgi:hypothetical protein